MISGISFIATTHRNTIVPCLNDWRFSLYWSLINQTKMGCMGRWDFNWCAEICL